MRNIAALIALAFCAIALSGCLSTTDQSLGIFKLTPEAIRSCAISCEWSGVGGACTSSTLVPIPWMQVAFLGILVILLFLSIAYMGSVVMKRVDWLIFVKEEFYQTILSAVMIFVVSWVAIGACEVSWALAGQSPFVAADIYLNNMIWEKSLSYAQNLFLNSLYLQITAAYFQPMGNPPSGLRPFAGLDAPAGAFDFLFSIVSVMFASLLMQVIMLKVIQSFMFAIVLPLGIFFRVFPFLRQAGATFIAIALAFYIVMPLMYVVDMKVVEQATGVPVDYDYAPRYHGNDSNMWSYIGEMARVDFFGAIDNVAELIPQAVFLPALNTIVVYAFMKSMAKIFAQRFPSPFE